MSFRIGPRPNSIYMAFRRDRQWRSDGFIPLIAIQLVENFRVFEKADVPRWMEVFGFLKDTFGVQFCFMFQIGKGKYRLWYYPKRLWLKGEMSEKREISVRYAPRLVSPLAS
ncbi:hypothetical protein F5B17DRAFT_101917 [Nemania serpens]|nr:hypothetical protein F5B17DRAFT_101917 [Nemania serpens]